MSPTERLKRLVGESDDFDLAEAALTLALAEYPELDIGACLARLDELADRLRPRLPESALERIAALSRFLFEEQGFAGNRSDYYDPRNSFLNEVLERRVGIPITLSVLYMEVGRRVGLPLAGVSFPGHFLVKCPISEGTVVIDPFAGGASVSLAELRERLRLALGEPPTAERIAAALEASTKRDILVRMLRNLKAIYLDCRQHPAALSAIDRILVLAPDTPAELRDRGFVYQALECHRAALADFQRYLELDPDADDGEAVRERIVELAPAVARLN